MKILIIVKSKHNDNTLKIAEAMSEAAPVTLTEIDNAHHYNLNQYDVIGLGSGIYFGKHDKQLFDFVSKLNTDAKYFFIFSTSGSKSFDKNNKKLVAALEKKGKTVLNSFGCLGQDKFFVFALFGGLNKNKPDISDFDNAQTFIQNIVSKYEEQIKH